MMGWSDAASPAKCSLMSHESKSVAFQRLYTVLSQSFVSKDNINFATETRAKTYWTNVLWNAFSSMGLDLCPCQNCPVPKWVGIKKELKKPAFLYYKSISTYHQITFVESRIVAREKGMWEHFFPFLICSPRIGNGRQRSKRRGWPPKKMLKETHQPQKNLLVTTIQPNLVGHFIDTDLEFPQEIGKQGIIGTQ